MWWRRSEQTNRVAAWYSMLGVVNMVSGQGSPQFLARKLIKPSMTGRQFAYLWFGPHTLTSSLISG
jgi:hypothetical protein